MYRKRMFSGDQLHLDGMVLQETETIKRLVHILSWQAFGKSCVATNRYTPNCCIICIIVQMLSIQQVSW